MSKTFCSSLNWRSNFEYTLPGVVGVCRYHNSYNHNNDFFLYDFVREAHIRRVVHAVRCTENVSRSGAILRYNEFRRRRAYRLEPIEKT